MESVYLPNSTSGFQMQLNMIDKRLQRARQKRDDYLKLLKAKYPQWTSVQLHSRHQEPIAYTESATLLDKLETGKYHWDTSNQQRQKPQFLPLPQLATSSSIPNSGPLLESELPSIKTRLSKIAEDLRELRSHRLHLSSAEFYATVGPSSPTRIPQIHSSTKRLTTLQSLRNRLEEIDTEKPSVIKEPNKEAIAITKADELFQKYRTKKTTGEDATTESEATNGYEHKQTANDEQNFNTAEKIVRFQQPSNNSATSTTEVTDENASNNGQQKSNPIEKAKQQPLIKDNSATSSYQKLLNMIKNESNDDKSDDDDFDPTFSNTFGANFGITQSNGKTHVNSSEPKPNNNSFQGSFLGGSQLLNSTDTDSDVTAQHVQAPSVLNDLDSDSEFFG